MSTAGEIGKAIAAKGDEIRRLKRDGVAKDALKPHINELLLLKGQYKTMTGTEYAAPGETKKETKAPSAAVEGVAEVADPNKKSKKQLNREKKEAEKAAAKFKAQQEREKKQAEASAKGEAQEA